jgi:hypothetical protein
MTYTPDDHRRAFEAYYRLRNAREVADSLGIPYVTVTRWQGKNVTCSCPWHNWKDLVAQREVVDAAKLTLPSPDPLATDALLRAPMGTIVGTDAQSVADSRALQSQIVRSDAERLMQLEFLWSKMYYDLTGLVVDHSALVEASAGMSETQESQVAAYTRGLRCKTADAALRALLQIADKIEELKAKLGLEGKPKESPAEAAAKKDVQSSLAELRQMRDMLISMPPDKLEMLKQVYESEQRAMAMANRGNG